jgi:hypothetical protein
LAIDSAYPLHDPACVKIDGPATLHPMQVGFWPLVIAM